MKLASLLVFAFVGYTAVATAAAAADKKVLKKDLQDLADLCVDTDSEFCATIEKPQVKINAFGKVWRSEHTLERVEYEKCSASVEYRAKCRRSCNIVTGGCDQCQDLIWCDDLGGISAPTGLPVGCESPAGKMYCPKTCKFCSKGRLEILEELQELNFKIPSVPAPKRQMP